MRVRDWMSPDPLTVAPATPLAEARRMLATYGIRHLPVVHRDQVVGMISDRDVRYGSPPSEATVDDVMSAPAHVVTVDATIEEAARLMLSRRISALPVLDADARLVGLLTTTDCLLASLAPQPAVPYEAYL